MTSAASQQRSNGPAGDASAGPSLSDEARAALSGCADGKDHNEEAFALLVGAIRDAARGSGGASLEANATQPAPWDELVAGNDEVRGRLVVFDGVVAQRSPLEDFWEDVEEWFVRLPDGRAICAYVVDPPANVARGRGVRLVGFLYKRVDAVDRSGKPRSYPAVVARVVAAGPSFAAGSILFGVVIAMLGIFVLLRWRVARMRRRDPSRAMPAESMASALDARRELPQDPAEALAALRRRSSDSS
ncbi:MAG: hypothetical protein U0572_00400 [Phycisphaerales bacterium]